jgi:hypothetical protein
MTPIKKQNKTDYSSIGSPYRDYQKMKNKKEELRSEGKRVKFIKTPAGEFQLFIKNIQLVDIRNHQQNTHGFRESRRSE